MEEPGRLQSMGLLESDTTERLHFPFSLSSIGEGNGNPLQCYCLENPRDGGAWWAAVYGIAQSRTRLKRLSSSSSSRTVTWRKPELGRWELKNKIQNKLLCIQIFIKKSRMFTEERWEYFMRKEVISVKDNWDDEKDNIWKIPIGFKHGCW